MTTIIWVLIGAAIVVAPIYIGLHFGKKDAKKRED